MLFPTSEHPVRQVWYVIYFHDSAKDYKFMNTNSHEVLISEENYIHHTLLE